jgi:hypothetical protein
MNPAGIKYEGPYKLPDNLKALFRSVSISLPNKLLISQVLMFSVRFQQSSVFSQKLVDVFDLSQQLFSK